MINILVVDDEEGIRIALKKVLKKDGYEVFLAESGAEGIDIVKKHVNEIETVISDFKMPGLDGLETLQQIGRINPEIIRIILTGYATLERAIESVNSDIDGFLTKPFDNNIIKLKIKEFHIKKRLKQFVPFQVLEELQKYGNGLTPKNRRVSVLFTDIRDFSGLSKRISTVELSELLNLHYFYPLDNIIFEHNGTLDKHIGDSIMGIFGAPISHEDDAFRAVTCAIKMRDKMAEINNKINDKNLRIPVGYGISTGETMVGIFGSAIRKEYTALGQTVNFAAHLEQTAKEDQILICHKTYQAVKDLFKFELLEGLNVKSMEGEGSIYNVVGAL
ncbi:MAG: adenylate/guanylate cyclase domain-containing response regulator [Desulfobacterium sp.]|nr:adenylate/guanylate cyclase domain-containing response regulator [Desulfobacterium sp.]MBU3949848.1 response regulator [Pseudomonadota bacterium]